MNISIISSNFKFSKKGIERIVKAIPNVKIIELGKLPNSEINAVIVDDSLNRELNRFPNLKIIFSVSAGVDNLLSDPTLPNVPIIKVTSQDMISLMREYVTYQTIRLHRRFKKIEQLQDNCKWQWLPSAEPTNTCVVTILGLGQLGIACAKALQSLGFQVFGWSNSHKEIDGIECLSGVKGLKKLLHNTNILVCLLPLTKRTKEILNQSLFYKLPKGAMLINASRGGCLNEKDLLNALKDDQISFATLDVFRVEPLDKDSLFWHHPKINITPHMAAYPHSDSFIDSLIENLKNIENKDKLNKMVNKKLGY